MTATTYRGIFSGEQGGDGCAYQSRLISNYASAHYTVSSEFLKEHAEFLSGVERGLNETAVSGVVYALSNRFKDMM